MGSRLDGFVMEVGVEIGIWGEFVSSPSGI